jgi:hybrid cluster-associated redox disulfide protein
MKKKITKNTTLGELLEKPETAEILLKYNVPCLGCAMASQEKGFLKIGNIAKIYGINIKNLLKELNSL